MAQGFSKQTIGFVACSIAHADPLAGLSCFKKVGDKPLPGPDNGKDKGKQKGGQLRPSQIMGHGRPFNGRPFNGVGEKPTTSVTTNPPIDEKPTPEGQIQTPNAGLALNMMSSVIKRGPKRVVPRESLPLIIQKPAQDLSTAQDFDDQTDDCKTGGPELLQQSHAASQAEKKTWSRAEVKSGACAPELFDKELQQMLDSVQEPTPCPPVDKELLKNAATLAKTCLLRAIGKADIQPPLGLGSLNKKFAEWIQVLDDAAGLEGLLLTLRFEPLVRLVLFTAAFFNAAQREKLTQRNALVCAAYRQAFDGDMPRCHRWSLTMTNIPDPIPVLEKFDEGQISCLATRFTALGERLRETREPKKWAPF